MVVTTCSIVFKGLIKTLWRTIPNFCSFWPQLDCRIPFWHLWLELSTLQDASHLPRATTQVTQRTAVGVLLATLASWPCWVAASTPASSFWELPEFLSKYGREFENNNVQTAFTPALSFWALPEFFDNFSSKSKLGFIQKLRCQNFYPVTSPSKSPYIENFHPKRALTLCFYLPTSSCQRSFRMTP